MHQRTITCSCLTDAYPLSQDPTAAEADVKDFLAQHAHPGVRPWPQPRRPDSARPAGYLAVFIDGPSDGEVRVLPEYVAEIPDARPTIPGAYKPEEARVEGSRILHYQWYARSPSVALQTSG
jgi:hypothetical protein